MTGVPVFDQLISAVFAAVCWVLAHQVASKGGAYDRAIGAGYSVAGFGAFASIVFHMSPDLLSAAPFAGSAAMIGMTAALILVSARIAWRSQHDETGG